MNPAHLGKSYVVVEAPFYKKCIGGISVLFIYILPLLYRNIHSADSEEPGLFKITDRVYTCSRWLSSLIDNICNNAYKIVKRDTSSVLMDKLIPKYLQNTVVEKKWRRLRRQVASECCDRPCTIGIVIMYCPEDARLLKENPSIFE